MAMSPGKPQHMQMTGHNGKPLPKKTSEHPMDHNPSGFQSKHEKM